MDKFDTYMSSECTVQLQIGEPAGNVYMLGQQLPFFVYDGVYIGYEGVVVIRAQAVQMVTHTYIFTSEGTSMRHLKSRWKRAALAIHGKKDESLAAAIKELARQELAQQKVSNQ